MIFGYEIDVFLIVIYVEVDFKEEVRWIGFTRVIFDFFVCLYNKYFLIFRKV